MTEFAYLVKPRVVPPLHARFAPAVLANHAYLKAVRDSGAAVPLNIALERHAGFVSVYKTICFDESHESSHFNLRFAERLVKFLLWKNGGWPGHAGEVFDGSHALQQFERHFERDERLLHGVPEDSQKVPDAAGAHLLVIHDMFIYTIVILCIA